MQHDVIAKQPQAAWLHIHLFMQQHVGTVLQLVVMSQLWM
jgi:ligand-binding SRPBCC domain-containing protein